MSGFVIDAFMVYQLLRRLTTPWAETDAFRLGLLDESGKKLRSPHTSEEKNAYGYFDRMVFNLKRLLEQVPGGKSRLASYAAALLLLREQRIDIGAVLAESAPTNATGSAVAGTGDNAAGWIHMPDGRRRRHLIDGVTYLKRQRLKRLAMMKALTS